MKIFLKTLIITLLLCAGYFFYVSLNDTSYNRDIKVPNQVDKKDQPVAPKKEEPKTKTIKIAFLNKSGDIKFVNRTADNEGIQTAITLLLKGPTDEEKTQGIYSEIPQNTKLRWVRENEGDLIVNVNEAFAQGGGTESIMARIDQLVKTVKIYNPEAPVFLYLDGKKAEYIGGEGVYLKQPLN